MNYNRHLTSLLLACTVACFWGCAKRESPSENFDRLIAQSPVIFLCEPEGGNFIIRKIYRREQSWGSDIRIGETIAIKADPKLVPKPFLILRDVQQYVSGGLGQSQIPVNPDGRLVHYGFTLAEVEDRIAKDESRIRSVPKK